MPSTLRLDARLPADVERAAALLREGKTVAFPTETVYGLGANALSIEAVERVFAAKERPAWDPLIVHLADAAELATVVEVSDDVDARVAKLAAAFWPGPLTLLLPRNDRVPDAVTAGRQLVGVRVPSHPVACDMLRQAGVPVAAPSANRFGHTSPTTAQHVLDDLDGRIDAVLDGGACAVGVESTVFDPAARIIYRPGGVTAAQIAAVMGAEVTLFVAKEKMEMQALPSPGVGMRHYAPRAKLLLVANELELQNIVHEQVHAERVGVMLPTGWSTDSQAAKIFAWGPCGAPEILAAKLFEGLRQLDAAGVQVIICPLPDAAGIGLAIRDRLEKAARTE